MNKKIKKSQYSSNNGYRTSRGHVPLPSLDSLNDVKPYASYIRDYAVKSVVGRSSGSPKEYNQDAEFIISEFNKIQNSFLMGVLDGHGVNGHLVSAFVKSNFIKNIQSSILNSLPSKSLNRSLAYKNHSDTSITNALFNDPLIKPEVLTEAFRLTDNDLHLSSIDINYSGSTFVALLLSGRSYICANVGDSRAIIGTLRCGHWMTKPISSDHKPSVQEERERIEKMNGRVEEYKDPYGIVFGPMRVWKKTDNVPGLAMSRSFGDKIAEEIGVISTPEIMKGRIEKNDKILVLASDGIWEFLSNSEVINIAAKYWNKGNANGAVNELIKIAKERWLDENEDVIDDITVIVMFFN